MSAAFVTPVPVLAAVITTATSAETTCNDAQGEQAVARQTTLVQIVP